MVAEGREEGLGWGVTDLKVYVGFGHSAQWD